MYCYSLRIKQSLNGMLLALLLVGRPFLMAISQTEWLITAPSPDSMVADRGHIHQFYYLTHTHFFPYTYTPSPDSIMDERGLIHYFYYLIHTLFSLYVHTFLLKYTHFIANTHIFPYTHTLFCLCKCSFMPTHALFCLYTCIHSVRWQKTAFGLEKKCLCIR